MLGVMQIAKKAVAAQEFFIKPIKRALGWRRSQKRRAHTGP